VCIEEGATEAPGFDGSEFVKAVLGGNLFTIPLDVPGEWFRFHHLFQEFLRRELSRQLAPGEIAALHLRASGWFESQGLFTEAIEHAVAAGDVVRAAEIVEANRDEEFLADRWYVVDQWLAMLPAEIRRERPRLLLTEVWIANCQHQIARVPPLLEQAESLLTDQTTELSLLGELDHFHGYDLYFDGEAERSRQFQEDAVSKLSGTRSPFLGEAELMLGLARCMVGQTELAVQTLENRIDEVDASQGLLLSRLIAGLVFIHLVCGDLMQARADAQRLQFVAKKYRMRQTEAYSSYMLACSYLHSGEFETALDHFAQTYEQRYVLESMAALDAVVGMALSQQLLQLNDEAMETAGRLAEFARDLNAPQYLSIVDSCYARIALLRGDMKSAADHARMISDEPTPANLFMWLESPPITKARVLIASGSQESLQNASRLLGVIRQQSEACRFTCQTIEVTVLQSLLFEKQGHSDAALKSLEEAVVMAEPGGWIRPFVESGRPMKELLERLEEQKGSTDFLRRVREAFVAMPARTQGVAAGTRTSGAAGETWGEEPLTRRELDILELLVQRLQNKEIASRLFVSPETVKTHLKHLYQKLDVSNRREAAARAAEILESTRPASHSTLRTTTK
jgi:LuxR family maltose regulon positive regulatory protein